MNLLHVTPYFAPAWAYGGVPQFVADLARAQVARGHRVTVLTTDALAPHERLQAGRATIDAVTVVRVRNVSGAARTWLNLSTPVGLRSRALEVCGEQALDVVHLHELRTVENLQVAGAMPHAVPMVVSPHGTLRHDTGRSWAKRRWDALLEHRLLTRVDRLIALSERERADIRRLYHSRGLPLSADRVSVVPNGVDLGAFDSLPGRGQARARFGLGGGPVVLFFGRLSPHEGVALLIAAFADVRRDVPEAQLLVAGPDHGSLAESQALVTALGLEAVVRFPGRLIGPDALAAFAAADLFALPAVGEGLPLSALHALAAGLPVLLSPDCNLPQAADAGRVVELTVPAWSSAIRSLLSEPHAPVAARARAVAAQFTWPAAAAALDAVYVEARNGRRG